MTQGKETLPPLRDVITRYRLNSRKSLGQHFLLDLNLARRIARAAVSNQNASNPSTTIVEVGPGPGGLTRALLEVSTQQIIAVERDHRCVEALTETVAFWPDRLVVREADALTIELSDLSTAPCHIVANLPYNIATALLLKWLKSIHMVSSMTLTFQKEVAERLSATHQNRKRAYSRLSVITQWLCHVRLLFDISPMAFVPSPQVISTVVHLQPRSQPLAPTTWKALETVTAAAFNQRRKMLRQSLKGLVPPELLCTVSGLSPESRAEDVSVTNFCTLARASSEEKEK